MGERTFEDFKTWLNTKPDDGKFWYGDHSDCAFARFLKETNRAVSPVVCSDSWTENSVVNMLPEELRPGSKWDASPLNAQTYGEIKRKLAERELR